MDRFAEEMREQLAQRLQTYSAEVRALPGAGTLARQQSFIGQVVESIRRIEYVKHLTRTQFNPDRVTPLSPLFDPLRGALVNKRAGDLDEALWLVFLATHFGKHLRDGYRLARDIYNGDGISPWTFSRVANNPAAFNDWLAAAYPALKGDGIPRRFGNHRKYETLRPDSARGTGRVFETYVQWVGANRRHEGMIADAIAAVGDDPKALFDYLYDSLGAVQSFGRTARFDYLTMAGKLELLPIEPGIPYLVGATGPLAGARLIFGGNIEANLSATDLDAKVSDLGNYLGVGMQVMEDSLCNWQKSPDVFVRFRG